MLLKQSPTEIDLISKVFYLSQGEKELLLSSDVGEGLFFAGQSHVVIKVIAAPFEHTIITSNPQELIQQKESQEQAEAASPPENPVEQAPSQPSQQPPPPESLPEAPSPTPQAAQPQAPPVFNKT